ncbi:MAG: FAD-dependent oxidoreductase [Candidatus Odinarchaeota archaeon]|nr:FAD-dependent oxidoreductase [Candidatus Odinarchaeota archaeon]
MSEKFDAVVVGAGPAGSTAAYVMAKAGLNVVLIERGKYAGSKNMSGAQLFSAPLEKIIPHFWNEAPVERRVIGNRIVLLSEKSYVAIDFRTDEFNKHPNSFTVLRAKFDQWLAKKAEEAGAMVITNYRVDDVIKENGKVTGVVVGSDKIPANVVIAADGALSFIAEKAGLRGPLHDRQFAVGVKEIIELPKEVIEERFNLDEDEGNTFHFVGDCTMGMQGGAILYTNKESLSLGIVVLIRDLKERQIQVADVVEHFKRHPFVKRLIKKGNTIEYSAHIIPESGIHMMPRLYSDGILVVGDAAGFTLNSGFLQRGMDFAIESGALAAKAVIEAHKKNDYSASTLSIYKRYLEESFVLSDLKTFQKAPLFMENKRIYGLYPHLVCDVFEKIMKIDGTPKQLTYKILRNTMKGRVSLLTIIKDGLGGKGAL